MPWPQDAGEAAKAAVVRGLLYSCHSRAVFYPSSVVIAGNGAGTALFVLGGW